jgi:hypothetical protein
MCIAEFKSFSLELVCSTKLVTELGQLNNSFKALF